MNNNLERNSINNSNIPVNRSGKKHASVVLRKIASGVVIVSLFGSAIYLSTDKDKIPVSNNTSSYSTENNVRPTSKPDTSSQSVVKIELTDEEKISKMFNEMYEYATKNEIKDLSAYYDEHYFDINYDVNNTKPNEELMYLYAANSYKKAHDKGLDDKTIVKELSHMYKLQEIPGCLFDEDAEKLSNLIDTLDSQSESLFMVYGPLSILAHNETCPKNHVINAAGGISHEGEEPEFDVHYTLTK